MHQQRAHESLHLHHLMPSHTWDTHIFYDFARIHYQILTNDQTEVQWPIYTHVYAFSAYIYI